MCTFHSNMEREKEYINHKLFTKKIHTHTPIFMVFFKNELYCVARISPKHIEREKKLNLGYLHLTSLATPWFPSWVNNNDKNMNVEMGAQYWSFPLLFSLGIMKLKSTPSWLSIFHFTLTPWTRMSREKSYKIHCMKYYVNFL